MAFEPSRQQIDEATSRLSESDLAHHFVAALNQLAAQLENPRLDSPAARQAVRGLIARLGDDLRMLRESWSGRTPSPPPAEGRPLQSRPDAPLSLLQRQAEAIAEGARMLVEETPNRGSATIPDAALGQLTQAQHLAAMILRVQHVERQVVA